MKNSSLFLAIGGVALASLLVVKKQVVMSDEEENPFEPSDEEEKETNPFDHPDAETALRQEVVNVALGEVGEGAQGTCGIYGEGVTDLDPAKVAWCGIFALWVLHQVGIGTDVRWRTGFGFAEQNLTRTNNPKPGDIAYIHTPYQHHAIVKRVVGDTVETIDGNQAGDIVAERSRAKKDFTAFYSIAPLLQDLVA